METMRINGRVYVSHPAWVFGDYGGAGSCGLANIRVLSDECEGSIVRVGMDSLRHISEGCPYGLGAESLAEILVERPSMILAIGDYGSEQAWIRKPLAIRCRDWMEESERSYSLSDDEVSAVEMEWHDEAWESWIRYDLIRAMDETGQALAESADESTLRAAYWEALEHCNVYPEAEYSGVHVDVARVAPTVARLLAEKIIAK